MVAVLTLGVERLAAMMAAERFELEQRRPSSNVVAQTPSAAAACAAEGYFLSAETRADVCPTRPRLLSRTPTPPTPTIPKL
jgi:hypothetical protein